MARRRRRRGDGSLRKRRDGRWEGTVVTGTRANGKPRRRTVYSRTKREAAEKLDELRRLHSVGQLDDADDMTVEECVERWLASRGNVLPDTRYKYGQEIQPLLDLIGDRPLGELKPFHIRDAYIALSRQGHAVRTQKRGAMHLRSALRLAAQDELVVRNAAEGIKVSAPRVKSVARVWTAEEVRAFLDTAKNDPLYPYFYLLLTLGLRSGEVLGLTWQAIDRQNATLAVLQALRRVAQGSRLELSEVKTEHSRRTLHVSEDILVVLDEQRASQRRLRRAAGSGWQDHDLVFTTATGQPHDPSNARRSLQRLTKAAGVRKIRIHDLRHTYASLALRAGIPVEVVSRRLGHASIAITLDLYRHIYAPEMRAAALSLEALLARGA